jgi:hypothetical protein
MGREVEYVKTVTNELRKVDRMYSKILAELRGQAGLTSYGRSGVGRLGVISSETVSYQEYAGCCIGAECAVRWVSLINAPYSLGQEERYITR